MSIARFGPVRCPHCGGSGYALPVTLGQRVRTLRRQAGLAQSDLASLAGSRLSARKIGDIETGYCLNPPLVHLRALAKVLSVTVGYLVDGDDFWDPLA